MVARCVARCTARGVARGLSAGGLEVGDALGGRGLEIEDENDQGELPIR